MNDEGSPTWRMSRDIAATDESALAASNAGHVDDVVASVGRAREQEDHAAQRADLGPAADGSFGLAALHHRGQGSALPGIAGAYREVLRVLVR